MSDRLIEIKEAKVESLDTILAIEQQSFPTPWKRKTYLYAMNKLKVIFYLAQPAKEPGAAPIAYILSQIFQNEVHILKIAVTDTYKRQGIATRLLHDTFTRLPKGKSFIVYLEVRPSNRAALSFYNKFGFDLIGKRPGYYEDTKEDALVLCRVFE